MMQKINAVKLFGLFNFNLQAFAAGKRVTCQEDADRMTLEIKEEIKKSFHKLALQLHPDKGGDAEKFKALSNAYDVIQEKFRIMIQPPQPVIQVIYYSGYTNGGCTSATTATSFGW